MSMGTSKSAPMFDALHVPPAALEQGGVEVLRAVIVEGALHVSLRPAFDDPQAWGMLLADVARHVSRIYQSEGKALEARTLERVRMMFDAELDNPTDPGTTSAVSERETPAMPINILMPALSPTMEKGNLAKWLKKEGDKVKPGDVIAEIETDKATMEYEAVDEGTLAKIVVPEGAADVPVNQLIAVMAAEGEDVKARLPEQGRTPHQQRAAKPAGTAPHPAPSVPPPQPQAGASAPAARPQPALRVATVARRRRAATAMVASSRRRWRGAWRARPASISLASRDRARMVALLRATWRLRDRAPRAARAGRRTRACTSADPAAVR